MDSTTPLLPEEALLPDNEEPELVAKLTEDPRSILAIEGQTGHSAAAEEILRL